MIGYSNNVEAERFEYGMGLTGLMYRSFSAYIRKRRPRKRRLSMGGSSKRRNPGR